MGPHLHFQFHLRCLHQLSVRCGDETQNTRTNIKPEPPNPKKYYCEHTVTFHILDPVVILDVKFAKEVESDYSVQVDNDRGEHHSEDELIRM